MKTDVHVSKVEHREPDAIFIFDKRISKYIFTILKFVKATLHLQITWPLYRPLFGLDPICPLSCFQSGGLDQTCFNPRSFCPCKEVFQAGFYVFKLTF